MFATRCQYGHVGVTYQPTLSTTTATTFASAVATSTFATTTTANGHETQSYIDTSAAR